MIIEVSDEMLVGRYKKIKLQKIENLLFLVKDITFCACFVLYRLCEFEINRVIIVSIKL